MVKKYLSLHYVINYNIDSWLQIPYTKLCYKNLDIWLDLNKSICIIL